MQRRRSHADRLANCAAKQPRFETWQERRAREEQARRRPPMNPFAGLAVGAAMTDAARHADATGLLDLIFRDPVERLLGGPPLPGHIFRRGIR